MRGNVGFHLEKSAELTLRKLEKSNQHLMKASWTPIATLALACTLAWGCESEQIQPEGLGRQPRIGLGSEQQHEGINLVCSDTLYLRLRTADGSHHVNYCGGQPCAGNQPEWGSVEVVNGIDTLAVTISMALGWFVEDCYFSAMTNGTYSLDARGVPSTPGFNFQYADAPVLDNKWTLFVDRKAVQMDINRVFGLAAYVRVAKLGFVNGVDSNSRRALWLANPEWDLPGSPNQSTGELLTTWQWADCQRIAEPVDSVCAVAYTGLPGNNGCASLSPNVNGAVPPLTYAWSTGQSSSTVTVCPSIATTYRVSVSDANGPYSVTAFQVNVVDASCRAGNSPQHKVWVCHIPPGNPNNPQNICIDWNGVPAHVARFRAPGANPNQGHDSGCEIGRCGSNPCQ
jgi:hypothetical protein